MSDSDQVLYFFQFWWQVPTPSLVTRGLTVSRPAADWGPGLWPVNLSHVKYQLPAVITITPPSLLSAKYFDERKQKISNNFDSRLLFVPFSSHIFAGLERSGYFRWKIYMLPVSSFLSRCNNLASYRVLIIIPVTPIRLVITIISGLKSPLWPVSRTRAQDKRESRTFRTFFLLAALDKFHSLNSQYLIRNN